MEPITVVTGSMVPLDRADVDTDQIMPKQFLKRIERTGFGDFIFLDWREDPDFILNDANYSDGTVLVSGPNFGAGSSREHAPWGLQQYGFRAIVAPSFADIFSANCAKIGLLTVELAPSTCKELIAIANERPGALVEIDLLESHFECEDISTSFDIDPHHRQMLMHGLDEIELTLQRDDEIARYEAMRPSWTAAAGTQTKH